MGRSLYELLSILNGLLLLTAGRVLVVPPIVDRLRWIGAWMMFAVGVRSLYQGYRLHELGDRGPVIPLVGWATAIAVFAFSVAFIHQWTVQRRGRG